MTPNHDDRTHDDRAVSWLAAFVLSVAFTEPDDYLARERILAATRGHVRLLLRASHHVGTLVSVDETTRSRALELIGTVVGMSTVAIAASQPTPRS